MKMAGVLLAAWPLAAQILRPQVGMILRSDGAVRPVFGLAASAQLGDPVLTGVISFASSGRFWLAKTSYQIVASTGETTPAPPGPAVFALTGALSGAANGGSAFLFFPETGDFCAWSNGALTPIPVQLDGRPLAMRALSAEAIDVAIEPAAQHGHFGRIDRILLKNGVARVVRFIGSFAGAGPVLLTPDGTISAAPDGIRVVHPDGTAKTFALAGVRSFAQMGDGYVEVATSDGLWILRTDQGHEQLYVSPGGVP